MTPGFWESRPELAQIRQHAQARMVGPWAVLGGVLARVIASTPPSVVLPPIVGGYGSLNLFIATVAASGGGKGGSQQSAKSCIELDGESFIEKNVGSGEGLAHAYVRREVVEKGKPAELVQHANSVLFECHEVDTIAAVGGRQGSTLLPELRKMWSGERLGFQNADEARRIPVEPHGYRAALIVGVQPEKAGGLLNDADGGTPQRFLWFDALDPEAPDVEPEAPEAIRWTPPPEADLPFKHGYRVMSVPGEVRQTIVDHRRAVLRGMPVELDGHALFARLKVAGALALLNGRGRVTGEDWDLAGVVMEVSDQTRARVQATIAEGARRTNRARAEARAEGEIILTDALASHAQKRIAKGVVRRLENAPKGITHADLRRGTAARDRGDLDAVLAAGVEEGAIISEATTSNAGRPGVQYRLNPTRTDS